MVVGRTLLWASLWLGVGADPSRAQTRPPGCFWPGPHPQCSSWAITESGLYTRISDRNPGGLQFLFTSAFGLMRNVGPRAAWGGELFVCGGDPLRGGVAVRTRRWLSQRAAADIAAGVHLFSEGGSQHLKRGSPMVTGRVTYADWVAVAARLDVLRFRDPPNGSLPGGGTKTRLYVGVEVGRWPGLVVNLAAGLGVLVAAGASPQ